MGWSKVEYRKKKRNKKKMKGPFWNIRGLRKLGRFPALNSKIRDNHSDFIGILETKKKDIAAGFLKKFS